MKDACKLVILALILVIAILLTFLSGCKTRYITQTEVVEVPQVSTIYNTTHTSDTIHTRDSVIIVQKGDTVIQREVSHHYHNTTLRDTLHQTDTITVVKPIEVPVEVEKPLTAWQRTKMDAGVALMGACGIGLLGCGLWFLRKRHIF